MHRLAKNTSDSSALKAPSAPSSVTCGFSNPAGTVGLASVVFSRATVVRTPMCYLSYQGFHLPQNNEVVYKCRHVEVLSSHFRSRSTPRTPHKVAARSGSQPQRIWQGTFDWLNMPRDLPKVERPFQNPGV